MVEVTIPAVEIKEYKYKEICEILGDKPLQGGKNRSVQLNKWKKEYKVEKVGSKYTYMGMLTEEEKELAEINGKYTTYIQNLLVALLRRNQANGINEVRLGHRELVEYLALVNDQYYKIKRDKKHDRARFLTDMVESKEVTEKNLYDNLDLFFEQSNRELKEVIKRALDIMEKRCLILYSKAYRFYKKIYYDESDRRKYYIETHECDDDEMIGVLAIYRQVFEEFGIETTQQIFSLGDSGKFYDRVNTLVKAQYGYDVCYETFRIWMDSSIKLDSIPGFEDENKLKLNENIQDKLRKMTEHKRFIDNKVPGEHIDGFVEGLISIGTRQHNDP